MSEHDQTGSADRRNSGAHGPASASANDKSREFLERGAEFAKPMADLGAQTMERVVVSCKLAGRAAENLSREATEYGQKSFEDAVAMARSFAEARTPADLIRVQSQFARAAFDNALAFSINVSDRLTKMASEVAEPSGFSTSAGNSGKKEH